METLPNGAKVYTHEEYKEAHPSPWEHVGYTLAGETECGETTRMKVPGGWLVRVTEYVSHEKKNWSHRISATVTFVPDPGHSWTLEEEETSGLVKES